MKTLLVGASGNPLYDAWRHALLQTSHRSTAIDLRDAVDTSGPHGSLSATDLWGRTYHWPDVLGVEQELDGPPDVILLWWGYRSLRWADTCRQQWPNARIALCLDTLPDARSALGEVREVALLTVKPVDGYIFASDKMRTHAHRLMPWARNRPSVVVRGSFPCQAFARDASTLPAHLRLEPSDSMRLIFTGRHDQLWTQQNAMRKDAVGPLLERLRAGGWQVWVNGLGDPPATYSVMPVFSNDELYDGTMATFLSQFDAQALLYNVFNGTIGRRVAHGLSTRLAIALTNPALWIVDSRSQPLAEEIWLGSSWGVTYADATKASAHSYRALAKRHAQEWDAGRGSLAMERHHADLTVFWEQVCAR